MHESFVALATKLIEKHGRDVTLRKYVDSGTAYNPTRTPSDQTIKIVQDSGLISFFGAESLIKSTKDQYICDSTVEIESGDKIVEGVVVFEVGKIMQIKPGETLIAQIFMKNE